MDVDFASLTEHQRYKLMASLIVPRPIALVTTLGPEGVVNAAPFSMFNMLGEEPPIVMLSINRLPGGGRKDTAANIVANREFVVHLTDEAMAQQMHRCGDRLPGEEQIHHASGVSVGGGKVDHPPADEAARHPAVAGEKGREPAGIGPAVVVGEGEERPVRGGAHDAGRGSAGASSAPAARRARRRGPAGSGFRRPPPRPRSRR